MADGELKAANVIGCSLVVAASIDALIAAVIGIVTKGGGFAVNLNQGGFIAAAVAKAAPSLTVFFAPENR